VQISLPRYTVSSIVHYEYKMERYEREREREREKELIKILKKTLE